MKQRLSEKLADRLEQVLPEQRLYLKSDEGTRFFRLRSGTQAGLLMGGTLLVGWTVIVTAFFLLDNIASSTTRAETERAQQAYERRVAALSDQRDERTAEAEQALERFYSALDEVSKMQGQLLASEQRVRELETGIEVIQRTLQRTVAERNEAREAELAALARLEGAPAEADLAEAARKEAEATAIALVDALDETVLERDEAVAVAETADAEIARMEAAAQLVAERNDRIFTRLEDAMETSLSPLRSVFERSGVSPDAMLDQVRRGYSGQGGPIEPLVISSRGQTDGFDQDTARANRLLGKLEEVDLHRIVAESLPLDHPVRGSYRRTSGFGPRWGRMHSGLDFAGARGTPIHATAAGVVTHAGWQSGYGKLVKIQHPFGFETRYAHLNAIRVNQGQRVSRGQRIGDMGTTGRSTGVHLHYEIRRNGTALNPATFISAGKDVF